MVEMGSQNEVMVTVFSGNGDGDVDNMIKII